MSLVNLSEIASNLKTQDNASIENPFYCVYEIETVVIDQDYSSRFKTEHVWISDEGCEFNKGDKEFEALEIFGSDDEVTIDGTKYYKVRQSLIPRFVTACLTKVGADRYIAANGHNLNKPYIYIHSLNRNAEMVGLRNHIINTYEGESEYAK